MNMKEKIAYALVLLSLLSAYWIFISVAKAEPDAPDGMNMPLDIQAGDEWDADFKKPAAPKKIIKKSKKKPLSFKGYTEGGDQCPPCLCRCVMPKQKVELPGTPINPYTR